MINRFKEKFKNHGYMSIEKYTGLLIIVSMLVIIIITAYNA